MAKARAFVTRIHAVARILLRKTIIAKVLLRKIIAII
jgi:hypothetical protein